MLFSDLEKITSGTTDLQSDVEIAKFSTDTRSLSGNSDDVFIAIKGKNRDGHDFIKSAQDLGVRNFIVEKKFTHQNSNFFQVDNSITAFQEVAIHHRNQFNIPVVGIAGSNGKTTVKEWLATILSQKLSVVKSPKSFNSQIGVPLSVLEIKPNHEVGVFEAGISQREEMEKLRKIIQPAIGIFTTLGAAHGDGFRSENEKLEEKLSLFANTPSVICRNDTLWFQQIQDQLSKSHLISWSTKGDSKYHVSWIDGQILLNGTRYQTNLYQAPEQENVTHCIIAAIQMGLSQEEIQSGLDLIRPIPMRLELKKGNSGCFILDDTYNNDLSGLKIAMDYLDSQKQNKKKTLILSDILYSGSEDEKLYAEVSSLLEEKNFTRLIGVGPKISSSKNTFKIDSTFFDTTENLLDNLPRFENETILTKGARDFRLERVVERLEEKNHSTILEVNFESLRHNLNQYRNLLNPKTKLMVMVKANAYGSGILEVSNFLQHEKVDWLGVAYVDEAIHLRNNGIDLPIMIMNPHINSFSQFKQYNLQAEIFSFSYLNQLLNDINGSIAIHLKIDTGMHRLGFSKEEIPQLINELSSNPRLKVISIFTHFSSSDSSSEDEFTKGQASQFDQIYSEIATVIGYLPIKHACNSPAMVRWPQYHYDMVRLGIGLHGFDPTSMLDLSVASILKTVISQVQILKKGETIGYSRKGKLSRDSKIAVLPIGYEDGYLRVFGNGNSSVQINGFLCPTIGNICMDMTMVDVTDIQCKEGDEAIVFGHAPSINDLAKSANTIPYEIMTNVSGRVKRVFVSE